MTPAKHQQNWLPGIFNDFFGNEWIAKTSSAAPAINIVETEKEYEVQIAAPGITKDDFDITVDKENHLVVTVEHKQEEGEKDKKGRYLRREFSYSQFQQTLILPDNVNTDAIEAHQNNGVLTVMIPKKQTPMMEAWKELKLQYDFTSKYLHTTAKSIFGIAKFFDYAFDILFVCLWVEGIIHNWATAVLASILALSLFSIKVIVYRRAAKILRKPRLFFSLPFFSFIQPCINLYFKAIGSVTRKKNFTWR